MSCELSLFHIKILFAVCTFRKHKMRKLLCFCYTPTQRKIIKYSRSLIFVSQTAAVTRRWSAVGKMHCVGSCAEYIKVRHTTEAYRQAAFVEGTRESVLYLLLQEVVRSNSIPSIGSSRSGRLYMVLIDYLGENDRINRCKVTAADVGPADRSLSSDVVKG